MAYIINDDYLTVKGTLSQVNTWEHHAHLSEVTLPAREQTGELGWGWERICLSEANWTRAKPHKCPAIFIIHDDSVCASGSNSHFISQLTSEKQKMMDGARERRVQ